LKLASTTSALVFAAALLTLSGYFANAGEVVYRWKDQAGNQVNSDRPPPLGIDYETISTSSSMVHTVDPAESAAPPPVKPGAGKDAPAAVAKTPATEKNPEYCKRAQDNLVQLDSNARIRLRDDQGEVRFLSEEEKTAERKKTLDAIKAFCD
jgi:hypothetical protein